MVEILSQNNRNKYFLRKLESHWALIPAPEAPDLCEFQISLDYKVSSRTTKAVPQKLCLQKTKQTNKENPKP